MRTLLTLSFVAALIAGCATVEDTTPKEDAKAGIEQWKCNCGLFETGCIKLTANRHTGTGTIQFDDIVIGTSFNIEGIDRRWDWCWGKDGRSDCAFIIETDGDGQYYNFRGSPDGRAKASRWFWKTCRRVQAPTLWTD